MFLHPKAGRLPDFIIGGAMKSGTTTLHHLLAAQPNIFIPNPEIHFFCIDDFHQVPDAFSYRNKSWSCPDYQLHYDKYLQWYASFFRGATEEQLVGEDSTVYLASHRAPQRIYDLLPNVKMIFILRDPVERAHSQYWHLVSTGGVYHNLERTLQFTPGTILDRSIYLPQLNRFISVFPRDQIKILIFEELVSDPTAVISELCNFLSISPCVAQMDSGAHRNRARPPKFLSLQLAQNFLLRSYASEPFQTHFPLSVKSNHPRARSAIYFLNRAMRVINRSNKPYPPMRSETRHFLETLLARKNKGLAELLERDLQSYWPYFDH